MLSVPGAAAVRAQSFHSATNTLVSPSFAAKRVEANTVLNGGLSLNLGGVVARGLGAQSLQLDLRGFNLTDLRYETAGYVYYDVPYFYPAAGRNVFVSLRAEF